MSASIKTLEYVTRMVESRNNPIALRFEPAMFQGRPEWAAKQIPLIQKFNTEVNENTAWMICASSWGYYQILGANIYALGFESHIAHFWNDIIIQHDIFSKFCQMGDFSIDENVAAWGPERLGKWATHQNGDGNIDAYIAQMMKYV